MSRVTKKCGTVVQLCVVRSAMMRPSELGTSMLPDFFSAHSDAAGAGGGRLHIRGENLSARAGAAHRREIDAEFFGETAGLGRDFALSRRAALTRWPLRRRDAGGLSLRVRSSSCGRRGRFAFGRRLFAGRDDPRDRLSDRNIGALGRLDSRENAVGGRFHFDDRFVGFDFEERLALGDAVAFLLPPGEELAGFLRHLEGGHDNAEGHSRLLGRALNYGLQPETPTRSVFALASIISSTRSLGEASVSRVVGSGPFTV